MFNGELPLGTAPNFLHLLDYGRYLFRSPEADTLRIYKKACQYLLVHGDIAANFRVVVVQEALVMFFYVLINNLPLKWKFGDLQHVIVGLQHIITNLN